MNGKSTFCAHIHISYVIILYYIKCRHKLLAVRKRKICQKATVLSLLMKRVGIFLITITSDSLNQQPLHGTMLLCFHRIMFKADKQCSHSILREKKKKRFVQNIRWNSFSVNIMALLCLCERNQFNLRKENEESKSALILKKNNWSL